MATQKKSLLLSWLSPAGAFIVLISFFLPWLEVHCSGKKILGSGFTFANKEFLLWFIPISALLVILLYVLYRRGLSSGWYKTGVILLAGLGVAMLMLVYFSIEQKMSGFIVKLITNHQIKIGLISTLVGFLLIFISSFLSNKQNS